MLVLAWRCICIVGVLHVVLHSVWYIHVVHSEWCYMLTLNTCITLRCVLVTCSVT